MLTNIVTIDTSTLMMIVVLKLFLNCEAMSVGKMMSEETSNAPTIFTPMTMIKALIIDNE